MATPASRSLTADGQAIERFRLEKGWSIEKLAQRADVSDKTVRNLIRGERAYLCTLQSVADALGVELRALLKNQPQPATPPAERTFQVSIVLSIPYQDFDQSVQLTTFIQQVMSAIKAKSDIPVVSVSQGSTAISVEMTAEELYQFAQALHHRAFEEAGVSALIFPSSSNIPANVRDDIYQSVSRLTYAPGPGTLHHGPKGTARIIRELAADGTETLRVRYE